LGILTSKYFGIIDKSATTRYIPKQNQFSERVRQRYPVLLYYSPNQRIWQAHILVKARLATAKPMKRSSIKTF
jgi:hypothetical protein